MNIVSPIPIFHKINHNKLTLLQKPKPDYHTLQFNFKGYLMSKKQQKESVRNFEQQIAKFQFLSEMQSVPPSLENIVDKEVVTDIIKVKKNQFEPGSQNRITACPHRDAKYYAKGMCVHCYHQFGRTKLATKCPHTDKTSYAKNMCVSCYQK